MKKTPTLNELLKEIKEDKQQLILSTQAYKKKLINKFSLPVVLIGSTIAAAFTTHWFLRKKKTLKSGSTSAPQKSPLTSPLINGLMASIGVLLPKLLLNLYEQTPE